MSADGRRTVRATVIVVLVALVVGACSSPDRAAAPEVTEPSTTVASTTSVPTSSSTTIVARSSTTSTTARPAPVSVGPGDASISGTVQGPTGPVDGATVKIERFVGSVVATADVVTSGGGAWRMDSVLGGAYRIRAFKAPDVGQSNVEVFFLAATERKVVDLRLTSSGGQQILAVINPNPPRVNQPAVITVQIGAGRVDEQGRPAIIPMVGLVLQLSVGAGQALESSPQVATDATGSATWRVRCLAEGPNPVTLTIGNGVTQVSVPACAAAGAPPAATTTTRPR